jgi:microsomal dipeptidase-like Zn-dependent dipeptidase
MKRKIFDAHCDSLIKKSAADGFTGGDETLHADLPRLIESDVTDMVMAVCIEPYPGREKEMWDRGLKNYESISANQNLRFHFAVEGCLALALGWELPFNPLVASLTWNGDNPFAGGIGSDMDLTKEGRKQAEKFIAENTAVDVSHLNDRSRKSLLKLGFPVCATHCNARRLCSGHNRNLPDEDLIEISAVGGVIGITFVPGFLNDDESEATVDSIVNHLEYIAEKTSIDSVGFGSDFDGVNILPAGILGVQSWNAVIKALESRGWSNVDIDKAAGNNWRRFFGIES